ncbi:MAG: replication restart helicase PriA [Treponemataceae bacterium]
MAELFDFADSSQTSKKTAKKSRKNPLVDSNYKGIWLEVVLNVPLFASFTYKTPLVYEKKSFDPAVGKRVEVFFRNKKSIGYIIALFDELPADFSYDKTKIKDIIRVLDENPLLNPELLSLGKWMSSFYLASLGEILSAITPSGKKESSRFTIPFAQEINENPPYALSAEQNTAISGILAQKTLHYLYGFTGSGKTEVFLKAAEKIMEQNQGVIYLVPEIGLTHQLIDAIVKRFGKTLAVLHSGLTPSQKLKEWNRILQREARIVIGARSAIFAPVPDLGLIIIDEEHDSSYKSGNAPRYHARQVAMKRAKDLGIPLVMGSATPSVEAWKQMLDGQIIKHTLTKRLSGGHLPVIEVIDLSKSKCEGSISSQLQQEIIAAKNEGKQSVLFLNRRGFTHYFMCKTCGNSLVCKNCSVPLTYHKKENHLRCHYCGWSTKPPLYCPECQSIDIGSFGFGTEFIEAELKTKFPHFKIIRLDTDSITEKGQFEKALEDFKEGKADILVGTQMIAKGLNFPHVKLVGIVNADIGLQMPDFRSSERIFSLIVQAAGRAGRYFPDGKVIVQSYNPQRNAIAFACKMAIDEFYRTELEDRRLLGFPPFTRLIRLVFRSKSEQLVEDTSSEVMIILTDLYEQYKTMQTQSVIAQNQIRILGPSECPLSLIAQNYRYQILLCAKKLSPLQNLCRALFKNYKPKSGVYIEIDVDPIHLL